MSLINLSKIVLAALFIITINIFAHTPANIPVFEDPALMTVWGSCPELKTVSFICDAINLPHDYSPGVTPEIMSKGTGLDGDNSQETELSWMYEPGNTYKTLIVIICPPANMEEKNSSETNRILKLASIIKESEGKLLIVDIETDTPNNAISKLKIDLVEKILPLSDLFVQTENSIYSYGKTLDENNQTCFLFDNTIDLMNFFVSIFGDNRCCD